jgi:hypothetical protein
METLKDKTKAMRQKVRALREEFMTLNNEIMAQIHSTSDLQITDPTDKLRFYLLDEVCQGFSHTTSSLHRIWDTYPAAPVAPTELDVFTNYKGDSDGTVGVD